MILIHVFKILINQTFFREKKGGPPDVLFFLEKRSARTFFARQGRLQEHLESSFFLSGASQNTPSGHDPQNIVSLLQDTQIHERKPSDYCVSSRNQRKSPKIDPMLLRILPRVSPGLAQRRPEVKRKQPRSDYVNPSRGGLGYVQPVEGWAGLR